MYKELLGYKIFSDNKEELLKEIEKGIQKSDLGLNPTNDGKIISHSYNTRQKKYNVLGHAEINAIIKAEKKIKDWRLNGYKMV